MIPLLSNRELVYNRGVTWLLDPSEYPLPNPRIDGWKKLREVNARTVTISVFPLDAFRHFRETNELPPEFENALKDQARTMIDADPAHAVLVRRAFVVPGLENPPGPRFLGLKTEEAVLDAVKGLYRFAIKHGYDKDPKSQISGWLEPPSTILDLEKFQKNPSSIQIPYGGYAISENGGVEIFAVFGINEGVQSLVSDRYLLEYRRKQYYVVRKEIPQKNFMLCTTTSAASQLVPVPVELQFDQVLSDNEIPEVARVVHELSRAYGPQRVEFSTDQHGICFNEVAEYVHKEAKDTPTVLKVQGSVLPINGIDDLAALSNISKEQLQSGETVVLVGKDVIKKRNYDVLGALSSWKDRLYVLYPGFAATQHAVRILADKGHRAFLVGSQQFKKGDRVQITASGGKAHVTNLTRRESQKVIPLSDASLLGVELCGGKANRLSQLKLYGFQVAHGSVCTTVVFDELLKLVGVEALSLEKFAHINRLIANSKDVAAAIDQLVPDYRTSEKVFAVRSSATIEDGHRYSLAGIFESFLNVHPRELTEKIRAVILSTFSKKAAEYLRHEQELLAGLKMAVVVQEMVSARVSGVIFGANVQTGDPDTVEIESAMGFGEALVAGDVTEVERYRFNRQERRMIARKGPSYLTHREATALFMLSERLRDEFSGVPQDIEWAIDHDGQIWILQSRDLFIQGS